MILSRNKVVFGKGCAGYLKLGRDSAKAPAVLLHGFGGNALSWHLTLPFLAMERQVFALDLPGNGVSKTIAERPSLEVFTSWTRAAIDALEIICCHIIGHSMGGRIAVELALTDAQRFLSLSLIATAGISAFNVNVLRNLISIKTKAEAEKMASLLLPAAAEQRSSIASAMLRQSQDPQRQAAWQEVFEGIIIPATTEFLPTTALESLSNKGQFLWGESDSIVPVPHECLPDTWPLHLLPGIGHLPQLEAPLVVNRILNDFLRSFPSS